MGVCGVCAGCVMDLGGGCGCDRFGWDWLCWWVGMCTRVILARCVGAFEYLKISEHHITFVDE